MKHSNGRTGRGRVAAAGAGLVGIAGLAVGQDGPPPQSPADVVEALRAAGVVIPEGFVVNGDGTVTVPEAVQATVDEAKARAAAAAGENAAVAADTLVDTPVEAPPELKKATWDSKIDLSLAVTDGNSENTSFRVGYVGVRTGARELSELSLDASYAYATSDGKDEVNEATVGVNHDWLFPESRWLAFAGGRVEWDMFRSWRYRASAEGGVGYKVIDKEDVTLIARAGGALTREFGSDNDDITPEGVLGLDFRWQVAENQSFEATTRFYPDLSDLDQFRIVSTVDWRLDLDEVNDGLGLVAGLRHEHQSEVDPGTKRNDVSLFAGVSWDF